MKQKKQLCLLLGLLAASILMYTGVCISAANRPKPVVQTAAAPERIFDLKAADVSSMKWNNGETDVSAERTPEGWVLSGSDSLSLQVGKMDELAQAVVGIRTARTLENGNASEYGLDDPFVISAVLTDGKELELHIGSRANVGEQYYLQVAGEDKIYLVSTDIPERTSERVAELLIYERAPSMESPKEMLVEKQSGESMLLRKPEDPEQYTYTDYYTWFAVEKEKYKALDREKAEKLTASVMNPQWRSCAAYGVTDLAAYGLDTPSVRASVTDGEKTICVIFGKETPEGSYYSAFEGSDTVYTVKKDDFEALATASYDTLRAMDVCKIRWETVDQITIRTADGSITIDAEPIPENEKGERYLYTENGRELNYETVTNIKALIDKMILSNRNEASDPGDREPDLSLTFVRNKGTVREVKLEFLPYDGTYHIVRLNGEIGPLISVKAAEAIVKLKDSL